jgi:hypothetical protein
MNIISAYRQVRSYRGAAELCGTTHKGSSSVWWKGPKPAAQHRTCAAANLIAEAAAARADKSGGWISAKRLLAIARPAG